MALPQQNLLPAPTVVDDTHKVYSIAIACIILGCIASLIVLWRLAVRWYARAFGADDWAMVPALVSQFLDRIDPTADLSIKLLYIGWTTMAAYVNLHAGVGKPLWEITVGEYSVWFKVCRELGERTSSPKTRLQMIRSRRLGHSDRASRASSAPPGSSQP